MPRMTVQKIETVRECQALIGAMLDRTQRPEVAQQARRCINQITFRGPSRVFSDVSWNEMIADCLTGVDYTFVVTIYESGAVNAEISNASGPREEGVIAVHLLPIFGIVRALFAADERTQKPSRLH